MKKIKKLVMYAFVGVMAFDSGLHAECPYVCKNETKKIATSTFLNDLAKTCDKVGKAVGAQDQKQRQQAACEIVGSLLSLAANVTQKNEKDRAAKSADQATRIAQEIEEIMCASSECRSVDGACNKTILTPDKKRLAAIERKISMNDKEFSENFFASITPFVQENIVAVVKHLKHNRLHFRDQTIADMAIDFADDVMEDIDKPVTNSDGKPVVDDGTQVSQEVLTLMGSIWHLVKKVLKQNKNVLTYLKEQAILLSAYMYERIVGEVQEDFFDKMEESLKPQDK
ncbi:hypothetical protein K2W90_06730 [Candidatus Babeliales bacterium]|nr:hypothetical protein [Candidatus Babeliales bacterium]